MENAKFSEMNASKLVKMKKNLLLQKTKLEEIKKSHRKIDPRVRKHISNRKARITALKSKISKSPEKSPEKIRLVLKLKDSEGELAHSMDKYGGRIIRKRRNLMAVEIPVDRIEQLVEENDAIARARFPFKLYPHGDVSEGVEITNADIFHDTVYKGSGVKVAVIDVGFMGLTEAIENGDLPENVVQYDFSGLGLETEYVHGTGCAEIIHDMAPDAELHLIKLGDETETWELKDYCVNNEIDIISWSLGTFGSGPGNGTGPLDEVFDEIREAGVLAVASAGNSGNFSIEEEGETYTLGSHWEGTFYDSDDDLWHEFDKDISYSVYNVIGAYPDWNDEGESETDEVTILMRWDDWAGTGIDYDLTLFTHNPSDPEDFEIEEISWASQEVDPETGIQYAPPMEYISVDIRDWESFRYFSIVITRWDEGDPTGINLELYLGGTSAFLPFTSTEAIAMSSSSITEPADAESVLAVGAIDYMNWAEGPQEDFSSQGPTNDWNGSPARIKPDIMGPDGVTTFAYTDLKDSPFFGTSAAAPHVAGLAALILSAEPDLTVDELQRFIESTAIDMEGESGKDNIFGWGRMEAAFYIDSDNDGIPDGWEDQYGLNPQVDDAGGDPDDDGHTNINEYMSGTLPDDPDTDDDGIPDGWEVQYGLYPLGNDAGGDLDGDEVYNYIEYIYGTLPNDPDTDDDGMPDGWEVQYSLDPLVDDADEDEDGDDFSNLEEYLRGTLPNNPDTDDDGMPDGWEVQYDLDPLVNDADEDLDDDGYTNIIEYNAGTSPDDQDTDDDGIADGVEDANLNGIIDSGETDPLDNDTDDDGIIDGDEDINHNGVIDSGETDPTDSDTDDDGMPDGWEVQYSLDPLADDADEDADGDDFSNLEEYLRGTLPNNAQSKPSRFMPWLPLLLD
ncbi:S8 family serine peptidase [Thermodesulfobacteriota bacterium]